MARKFDHLVLCAADLDRVRQAYRSMGFTLTPRAEHPFGTCNSLAQLQGNFLELLAVADPRLIPPAVPGQFSFAHHNQAFLEKREGLSMLVFVGADAAADAAEFRQKGLDSYEPFHFARQATLPDGSKAHVGFSLAFVTHKAMPEAAFFTCQQHAPQYFWRPEYQRHANGAIRLVEVVMSAARPDDYRDFFERLMQVSARASPGALSLGAPESRLSVLDRRELAARFPEIGGRGAADSPRFEAYAIEVADIEAVKGQLLGAEVPFRANSRSLVVPPSAAFGVAIEFRASD